MLKNFYRFVSNLGTKYSFLKNNAVWRNLKPFYSKFKSSTYTSHLKPNEESIAFFTQNADRVTHIASLLADEQSKREYLGNITFRQTCQRKDFPLCDLKTPQYFIKELSFDKDETFIDCGAFVGDTIDEFIRHCKDYNQIIAFEPDTKSYGILKKKYRKNPKIQLINAATNDVDGQVYFSELGNSSSFVSAEPDERQENTVSVQAKAIDNLNLGKVSFIKMDVEGAEMNSLKGAEKTIVKDKPKLAICIYHSNEDMLRIPEYIHQLVPEYKLFVRQHFYYPFPTETVLYAIIS